MEFNTVKNHSEILFKERNSKFFGYTFPISNENEFKDQLNKIKELHPDAGHHCYAFRIGIKGEQHRYSDDGEPNNSAGKPIYGQLLSSEVTNIGAVVVRYFGGTKLGVGGLITAYKEGCKLSLEANEIITTEIKRQYTLTFGYDQTSSIDQIIHQFELEEVSASFESQCIKTLRCKISLIQEFEDSMTERQIDWIGHDDPMV